MFEGSGGLPKVSLAEVQTSLPEVCRQETEWVVAYLSDTHCLLYCSDPLGELATFGQRAGDPRQGLDSRKKRQVETLIAQIAAQGRDVRCQDVYRTSIIA